METLPIEKNAKPKRKKKKNADSKETNKGEVDTSSILASLEADISQIRSLCRSCHIFEAQVAWGTLDEKSKAALRECRKQNDAKVAIQEMSNAFHDDPQFVKLRRIHGRLTRALDMLRTVDAKGVPPLIIKEPTLGEAFRTEVVVRACEGNEVEKGGSSTQLYVIIRVFNWPLSLVQTASVDIEADLVKKEWTKDCKQRDTILGGESSMFSNFAVMSVALSPLPLQLEDIMIREFSLVSEAPVPGSRPGLLVLENGAPKDCGRFENWNIPPPPKKHGHYRLGAGMKVHYKMRGQDSPDFTDMISISKVDLPIPTFLLPLSQFKKIIAQKLTDSLKLMKDGMVDHWSDLGFDARIAANPQLYSAIAAVQNLKVVP